MPPGWNLHVPLETFGWPTTAWRVALPRPLVNDMDNVERGAIGMILVHDPNDLQDVDVRLPTPGDPTAYNPALMPGGSATGSPIVRTPDPPPETGPSRRMPSRG